MRWLRLEGTSGRHLVHPNAQDHIQTLAEYLQGGQLHSLSGKPVPVLVTLTVEKAFSDVWTEPPVLLVGSCPVTGLLCKELTQL